MHLYFRRYTASKNTKNSPILFALIRHDGDTIKLFYHYTSKVGIIKTFLSIKGSVPPLCRSNSYIIGLQAGIMYLITSRMYKQPLVESLTNQWGYISSWRRRCFQMGLFQPQNFAIINVCIFSLSYHRKYNWWVSFWFPWKFRDRSVNHSFFDNLQYLLIEPSKPNHCVSSKYFPKSF